MTFKKTLYGQSTTTCLLEMARIATGRAFDPEDITLAVTPHDDITKANFTVSAVAGGAYTAGSSFTYSYQKASLRSMEGLVYANDYPVSFTDLQTYLLNKYGFLLEEGEFYLASDTNKTPLVAGSSITADPDVDPESGAPTVELRVCDSSKKWIPYSAAVQSQGLAQALRLTIAKANSLLNVAPLKITSPTLPDSEAGKPYTYQYTASGGVPPYTWSITNLSEYLDPATGKFTIDKVPFGIDTMRSWNVRVTDSRGVYTERLDILSTVEPSYQMTFVNAYFPLPLYQGNTQTWSSKSTIPAPDNGQPISIFTSGDGQWIFCSTTAAPLLAIYKKTDGVFTPVDATLNFTHTGTSPFYVSCNYDGSLLCVSGLGDSGPDHSYVEVLKRVDATTWQSILSIKTKINVIYSRTSRFSSDGKYLLIAGSDTVVGISLWYLTGDAPTKVFDYATGELPYQVCFSPDSTKFLYETSTQAGFFAIDAQGAITQTWGGNNKSFAGKKIYGDDGIVWSADSQTVFASGALDTTQSIYVWDVSTGVPALVSHTSYGDHPINGMCLSQDGKFLLTTVGNTGFEAYTVDGSSLTPITPTGLSDFTTMSQTFTLIQTSNFAQTYVTPPATIQLELDDSLTIGQVGNAYQSTLSVTNGTGPYYFNVIDGTLPEGITLTPNTGELSGTCNTYGYYHFTIGVVDSLGNRGSKEYTLVIASEGGTYRVRATLGAAGNATTTIVPKGYWNLAIAEFDEANNTLSCWINDAATPETYTSATSGSPNRNIGIGCTSYSYSNYQIWRGRLWGAGIANGRLTAEERLLLWNGGKGIAFEDLKASQDPVAVSLWSKIIYAWPLETLDGSNQSPDVTGHCPLTPGGNVSFVSDPKFGTCMYTNDNGGLIAPGTSGHPLESKDLSTWFIWSLAEIKQGDDFPPMMSRYDGFGTFKGLRCYWESD